MHSKLLQYILKESNSFPYISNTNDISEYQVGETQRKPNNQKKELHFYMYLLCAQNVKIHASLAQNVENLAFLAQNVKNHASPAQNVKNRAAPAQNVEDQAPLVNKNRQRHFI